MDSNAILIIILGSFIAAVWGVLGTLIKKQRKDIEEMKKNLKKKEEEESK